MGTNRSAVGRAGEEAAVQRLLAAGYQIIGQNVRFRPGEIDIIARDGGVLVFVEVKTRRGTQFGTPQDGVTPAKQRQLVRLAALYLAGHGGADQACRFDVVAVLGTGSGEWECQLIKNAFSAS